MASISARASRSATPAADTRSATVAPSNAAGGIPRVSPITVKPRLLVAAAPPGQEAPLDVLERLARFPFSRPATPGSPRPCARGPRPHGSVVAAYARALSHDSLDEGEDSLSRDRRSARATDGNALTRWQSREG